MRREKGRRERFVLAGDSARALRRKILTVVAPEVRVAVLEKESGFCSGIIFSIYCLIVIGARGTNGTPGAKFWAALRKTRGGGKKKPIKNPECVWGSRSAATVARIRTGLDRG